MRRTFVAATAGAVLLTISACGGGSTDSPSGAAAGATTAATATAVEPTEEEAEEEVDYSADTKKVCAKVDKLLEGKEMERFATELGTLILYKEAKQTAKANQTREDAKKELKTLAKAMRRDTSAAKDPEVKAAGEEAATAIEKSAGSNAFFAKVKTVKTLEKTLQAEIIPWLAPLGAHCG